MYDIYIAVDKIQKYIWKYPYIWQWAADGFGVSGFILKSVHIKASMQKRFLYIAIRKYDFVEKRARKARKPKSEKHASRNPKSARAEKRKTLTFQPLQDKIIEQIILWYGCDEDSSPA